MKRIIRAVLALALLAGFAATAGATPAQASRGPQMHVVQARTPVAGLPGYSYEVTASTPVRTATIESTWTCGNVYKSGVSGAIVANCGFMTHDTTRPGYLGTSDFKSWNPPGTGTATNVYTYWDAPGNAADWYSTAIVDGHTRDAQADDPDFPAFWDWDGGTVHIDVAVSAWGTFACMFMGYGTTSVIGGACP